MTSSLLTAGLRFTSDPVDKGTPGVWKNTLDPLGVHYTLLVPENIKEDKDLPLIIALHYGGMVTPYYGEGILRGLVAPALGDLGTFIAAPDCKTGSWQDPACVQGILALLEHLLERYQIDRNRILLCGYSMGGIGAWHTAILQQEKFCAVLAISAPVPSGAGIVEWKIPIYVIHSREDELFPYQDTQTAVEGIRQGGVSIEFDLVENLTHFDVSGFIPTLRRALPWAAEVLLQ